MTGVILRTAGYMSPEQAKGKTVDRRADIWSFGVVLFEMLTGRRMFTGETVSDVLAAVLRAEPDWKLLPAETPLLVRRVLRRSLTRDPRQRLHDIADVRLDLDEAIAGDSVDPESVPVVRARPPFWLWVIAGLLLVATVVLLDLRPPGGWRPASTDRRYAYRRCADSWPALPYRWTP